MFTAIVLVCASTIQSPETCYTYTNEIIYETKKECMSSIEYAFKHSIFEFYDDTLNEKHKQVNYYCVNWSAKDV